MRYVQFCDLVLSDKVCIYLIKLFRSAFNHPGKHNEISMRRMPRREARATHTRRTSLSRWEPLPIVTPEWTSHLLLKWGPSLRFRILFLGEPSPIDLTWLHKDLISQNKLLKMRLACSPILANPSEACFNTPHCGALTDRRESKYPD